MDRPYYKEPVFRPPSEARSLLIQATEGCTHRCTFCISNYGKKYLVRPVSEIKLDIDAAKKIYGGGVRRLFFLDGNALSMPTAPLVEICNHAKRTFSNLERIAVYACGEDVLEKSDEDLRKLANAGLTMVYIGLESGDDGILKKIKKNITASELAEASLKAMRNGITVSGTIILGIAGKDVEASRDHAINTGKLITAMCPPDHMTWYIGALTLMVPPHTAIKKAVEAGTFRPMDSHEILEELKLILENVGDDVHDCVFRSNHASNYLVLKGVLSQDKDKMIQRISSALENPTLLRPEFYRAL